MCLETLGIGLCAPQSPPILSFNCSKLHHIAHERLLCDRAKGACVCFFGTCGVIEKKLTDSRTIDLAAVPKVRCATCTSREDAVGGERRTGRQIIESPLLNRMPVLGNEFDEYMKMIKPLWGNTDACPYHQGGATTATTNGAGAGAEATSHQATAEPCNWASADVDEDKPPESEMWTKNDQLPNVWTQATNPEWDNAANTDTSEGAWETHGTLVSGFDIESVPKSPCKPDDNRGALVPNFGIESSCWAPGGEEEAAASPQDGPGKVQDDPPQVASRPPVGVDIVPQVASMKDFLKGHC